MSKRQPHNFSLFKHFISHLCMRTTVFRSRSVAFVMATTVAIMVAQSSIACAAPTAGSPEVGNAGAFCPPRPAACSPSVCGLECFSCDAILMAAETCKAPPPPTPTPTPTPTPQPPVQVACEYGPWSAWSQCSARDCSCGRRTRTRAVVTQASNPPVACNETSESMGCKNTEGCTVEREIAFSVAQRGVAELRCPEGGSKVKSYGERGTDEPCSFDRFSSGTGGKWECSTKAGNCLDQKPTVCIGRGICSGTCDASVSITCSHSCFD
jgi:hypothetical protein